MLIKELQSLGLDVKVLDKNAEEIDLKQNFDDDDINFTQAEDLFDEPGIADNLEGYSLEGDDVFEDEEDDDVGDLFDMDDELGDEKTDE